MKKKLLVVEDDHYSAFALRGILKSAYDVDIAETLAEARLKLQPDHSWVLLDLMLPDGDGETFLREIREQRMPVCVCVMTACSDHNRLAVVHSLQPDGVFPKPIDVHRLLEKLLTDQNGLARLHDS